MTSMNIAESNHNATDLGRPLHGYRSGHQIVPKSLMRLALQVTGSENFRLMLAGDADARTNRKERGPEEILHGRGNPAVD